MSEERKDKGFKKGGDAKRPPRDTEPKYNDTPEAEEQMARIRDIEKKMKDVQTKLAKLHTKGKEIERKVNLTLKDKSKAEDRVDLLRKRIEKLKSERAELLTVVKQASEVVEQRRVAEAKAKSGLINKKKQQTDEEFVNACLADIERRVKELNVELEQSQGSVGEERRLLKEVQRVRATKSQIPIYLQRAKALQEARGAEKRALRDLESKESFIATLEAELGDLKAEIATLDGKEQGETKPVKEALGTEEQQLSDELNRLVLQLRDTKDGLNTNREKWYEARREKARKAVEKQQQKRDEDKARRQKESRERAIAERAERKSVLPYGKEMGDLEGLLQYLDGLLESEEKAKAAPVVAPVAPVAAPKADDDDWGSFAANNRKNKNKNNNANNNNANNNAKKGNKSTKFVVNLQSMDQFRKLGFTAPMSMEAVPATRAAVRAKLDELQVKSAAELKVILDQIAVEEAEEARLQEKEKKAVPAVGAAPAAAAEGVAAAEKKE